MKKKKSGEKVSFGVKFHDFFVKCDNFLRKSFLSIKLLLSENPLVFYYILGSVFNGLLLRLLTVKNIFTISPILSDIAVSLFFSSFYFFISKKKNCFYRKLYIMCLSVLSIIIVIANSVYYSYYDSFISITFISFVLANHETGDANVIGQFFEIRHFLYFWFLIFMIVMVSKKKKKSIKETVVHPVKIMYSWFGVIGILFLLTLTPKDFSRFYSQWNREYLVTKFGVYLYQINDVFKSVEPKMTSLFGTDKAYKNISSYYEENPYKESKNKYTDILKGKNVIAIHAESMQNAMLGLKINGQEVTPNLNKLSKQGIYFSNFYSQVSVGTSSDTEFTLASSVLPINNGSVFINYYDRTYKTGYKELTNMGYYTFSMHANNGDFWNRNIMHKNLGYQHFYEKASYEIDQTSGFGLTDESFVRQSVDKIEEINKEHKLYYGTLITLTNHTPFADVETYGDFDLTMTVDGVKYPYLEGTKMGNYIKSVHYADKQIGLLVELLQQKGLLDNTVIMLYGDHDARLSYDAWDYFYNYDYTTGKVYNDDDSRRVDIDYYFYELNRKVPFIIWSNDKDFQKNYATEVTLVSGMYNVMPTLANMLGFDMKYALGKDVFQILEDSKGKKDVDNIVVFPGGNFVTNYIYYNDSRGEYKLLKDIALDDDYVADKKAKAAKILSVSNDIIVYNYFKEDNYEVEK